MVIKMIAQTKILDLNRQVDSKPVHECLLSNAIAKIKISSFGCTLQEFIINHPGFPKRDIVLGYDNWEDYKKLFDDGKSAFFGAIVGPIAGRISKASIPWKNEFFKFEANEGPNLLHGGKRNFSNVNWELVSSTDVPFPSVCFGINTKHEQIELPGELYCEVTYTLKEAQLEIKIESFAIEDTLSNPTQHSYFNPGGHPTSILDCTALIDASGVLALNSDKTPTGEILKTQKSPLALHLKFKGLDNAYRAAKLKNQASLRANDGFELNFSTNQPFLQIYVGGESPLKGKNNMHYGAYSGICLEQQAAPDAPNHINFCDIYIPKGQSRTNTLIVEFKQCQ